MECLMGVKRCTLKDISKVVNLAVPVISRILNDRETYCSAKKIKEVKDTAAALGYRRNVGYSIMTGSSTNIVAVIFSQRRLAHAPHINELYMSLCAKLRNRKYTSYCTILEVSMSAEEQISALQELDDLGCRSYIFIGYPTAYKQLQEFLIERSRSFIGMNNSASPRRVITDECSMQVACLENWLERGIENFRFVTSREFFEDAILKRAKPEYHEILRKNFLRRDKIDILSNEPDYELFCYSYEITKKALQNDPDIKAMLFSTDYCAFGAARVAVEAGRNDIELCGMNKSIAANYAFYPIRTCVFDMDDCAEKLVDNMTGTGELNILIPGKFVDCNVMTLDVHKNNKNNSGGNDDAE